MYHKWFWRYAQKTQLDVFFATNCTILICFQIVVELSSWLYSNVFLKVWMATVYIFAGKKYWRRKNDKLPCLPMSFPTIFDSTYNKSLTKVVFHSFLDFQYFFLYLLKDLVSNTCFFFCRQTFFAIAWADISWIFWLLI